MPAKSKAQRRYMCGICHGNIPKPKSLSQASACEYCRSIVKDAPERKRQKQR